ncbi:MAG: exodeoxyribonuclease VII large subunit [Candidatus Eisenbacteria bacterium]|nr:exodeoxyribonuclease VII large subunit [Candidatus Eisenbacteria bacterium]
MTPSRGDESRPAERTYTVSEVTAAVKHILEESLPSVWVEGEISNFNRHSSGHMYFTLKDEKSQLPAVMFRQANAKLAFAPQSGMKVLAFGRVGVYEPSGRYQLYVERMRPAGIGELAAAFEALKRKLEAEGLFDKAGKVPAPRFPRTVAVVTSPTGAAVRDVIRVARARMPSVRIVVVPVPVQGAEAAPAIVAALGMVDEWGGADVCIVGRGGGSLEDLWAFNDERVARAIHAMRTPVISAVGHEVDFTIADFVADVRAATPSNAAEIAVPDRRALLRSILVSAGRVERAVRSRLRRHAERAAALRGAYGLRIPLDQIERLSQRVDELGGRAAAAARTALALRRARVERYAAELALADPAKVLARGFASVALLPVLSAVTSAADVAPGSQVRVTVADGAFDCTVNSVRGGKERAA